MRYLRRGDNGPDVRAVQQGLNLRRLPGRDAIGELGVFDDATDTAVPTANAMTAGQPIPWSNQ